MRRLSQFCLSRATSFAAVSGPVAMRNVSEGGTVSEAEQQQQQQRPEEETSELHTPNVREAQVVSETVTNEIAPEADDDNASEMVFGPNGYGGVIKKERVKRKQIKFVNSAEQMALEIQKAAARNRQKSAFHGSKVGPEGPQNQLQLRERRSITRVPQYTMPYVPLETSFRRLPSWYRLPDEHELRMLYPKRTNLAYLNEDAPCAHMNAGDMFAEPDPIHYTKLVPPNYDPKKTYPTMVALADSRGDERDFEDMCFHLFERPLFREGWQEQEFVILSPRIHTKLANSHPFEAVLSHFCDWVVANHNVEGGKVHILGKGMGGYLGLRTCFEYPGTAQSVVAILGRMGAPFRVLDKPWSKVKNMQGVHTLVYVPGLLRKVDWPYKYKQMLEIAETIPAPRYIHYANVRDHQIYYAINPYEFWGYYKYFRESKAVALPRHPFYQQGNVDETVMLGEHPHTTFMRHEKGAAKDAKGPKPVAEDKA